jgi:hypothetical protein
MKKVCAKIITRNLTEDQKITWNGFCSNFLNKTEEIPIFLIPRSPAKNVASSDTTWK